MENYEILDLVGEGSFGKVYKAKSIVYHDIVAFKIMPKTGRSTLEVTNFRKEREILKGLHHPNIVRMFDSFETETQIIVVTEFACKDLSALLAERKVLQEFEAQSVICDLISALYYLHSHKILHRDLKPKNVLVTREWVAKLCDFGFATNLFNNNDMLTSFKGTPLYMAPELIAQLPYDYRADLWSLGCVAYELITGKPPFVANSITQLIKMIYAAVVPWPDVTPMCSSFLKGLLQTQPFLRLSWPHLFYHPFVSSRFTPPQLQNVEQRESPSAELEPILDESCSIEKQEWVEFLRNALASMVKRCKVDIVTDEASFLMLSRALENTCGCLACCKVVEYVSKLVSIPFVLEKIGKAKLKAVRKVNDKIWTDKALKENEAILPDMMDACKAIISKVLNGDWGGRLQEAHVSCLEYQWNLALKLTLDEEEMGKSCRERLYERLGRGDFVQTLSSLLDPAFSSLKIITDVVGILSRIIWDVDLDTRALAIDVFATKRLPQLLSIQNDKFRKIMTSVFKILVVQYEDIFVDFVEKSEGDLEDELKNNAKLMEFRRLDRGVLNLDINR